MYIFRFILFLISALLFASCGGGGGSSGANPSQPTLTTTAGDVLTIPAGAFKEYSVSGGVPPYQVSSSEPAIAVASISDKTLSIGAISGGKAVIRVFDFRGTKVEAGVTVGSSVPLYTTVSSPFTLRPSSSTVTCTGSLSAAERAVYAISGGSPPYRVASSNTGVLAVGMTDGSHWEAVATAMRGSATVRITDATGANLALDFSNVSTAGVALTVTPTELTMPAGYEAEVTVAGGMPPYRAAGGIPAAIQVTPGCNEDGKFKLKGNLTSGLDIGFVDSAGQSVKVKVTINTATPSFRMSPSPMLISENGTDAITLSLNGFYGDTGTAASSGSVCIYVSDPTFFSLDASRTQCSTFSPGARTFTLNTGSRGNRCVNADTEILVRAVDSAQQTASASITIVNNGTGCNNNGALSVSPSAVTVRTGLSTDVLIRGGAGLYSVASANPAIATAVIADNLVTITGGATSGSTTVLVTDAASGNTATVTVTNSTGGGGGGGGTFSISPNALSVNPNGTNTAAILNGSGTYVASSGNPAIATATIGGSSLTVRGGSTTGSTTITVTDTVSGSTASVTVTNAAGSGALTVSPSIVYTVTDVPTTAFISGGSGTYGVSNVNGAFIKAAAVSGTIVTFTGGDLPGSVTAVVFDLGTGSSASVLVVNNNPATTLTAAWLSGGDPANLISNGAVLLGDINGGSGSYVTSSADNLIAGSAISGNRITITPRNIGATAVTVTDTTTGRSLVIGVSVK